MAASLRASLLALLLASSLVPVAGVGLLEYRALAQADAAAERDDLQLEAMAAALRADAAVSRGADPLVAAADGTRAADVFLVDAGGVARDRNGTFDGAALRALAGDALTGVVSDAPIPTGGPSLVAWARAPDANALVVAIDAPGPSSTPLALPFVALAFFVASGAALLLAFVGTRVVGPVSRLERASLRLARGDWGDDVRVEGPREVRALGESFNEMARSLRRQQENLDALVRERTGALIDRESDLDALRFTLAHEFREPLRSLRWVADDLLERPLSAEDREAVLVLRKRIDDVDAVFVDLLRYEDVARRAAPIEPVDLGEVVDRAATEAPGARVDAGPLPHVRGNADLLALAFVEILRNVAQHGDGSARVRARLEGEDAVVRIDDEGPGIPPERREDALHLFRRLGPESGTGAGLAIARKAIERHGGSIAIDAAPGGGARVVLRLPLAGPAPPTPLPDRAPARRF